MSIRLLVIVLSVVLLAQRPSDGGIILDKISSFVNKFVPLQRKTTTALPPTASTPPAAPIHTHGGNSPTVLPPAVSEVAGDNSTLVVTSLPDDSTTPAAANHSHGGISLTVLPPTVSEVAGDNSTLVVTSLPDDSTTPAAANHSHGGISLTVLPPTVSEVAGDNSTLVVTSLPDDLTTASSNNSLPKRFIIAPNLAKCGSGFRVGHNGRCHRIV